MLVNRDSAASSAHREYVKSDYCLCLAIHAPRKGIVEVLISFSLRALISCKIFVYFYNHFSLLRTTYITPRRGLVF